jgi:hypothetical protein
MAVSRDEVILGFRLVLGREPDSESAIAAHMDLPDLASLLADCDLIYVQLVCDDEAIEGQRGSGIEMHEKAFGLPGGNRTPDNRLRRPVLYPTELRAEVNRRMIPFRGALALLVSGDAPRSTDAAQDTRKQRRRRSRASCADACLGGGGK